jgi:hypothetical protein
MARFKKQAYSAVMNPGLRGVTLGDLIREVRNDVAVSGMDKTRLLSQIDTATGGASPSTPLSAFAAGGIGALVANLAGKYFGLSTTARALVTAAGFGLGNKLNNAFGPPAQERRNTQGWQFYG